MEYSLNPWLSTASTNSKLQDKAAQLIGTPSTTVAKSKSKSILVQMMSAAGTGYCFNAKRSRLRDKLVLRKHDPRVNKHVLFFEKRKIRSI
ncbi:39S ribosomal protein L33, mitochondrial isoform X3 [Pristis pectinata]|uniref:39S ribosomal protein L33, mitochondrial isoform X3 n=1 Tax=Pristis pectinata TaxID=685728 RepID=UPI00223DAFAC|nr:39S ribosomal protein L33, mitochondrial isoform X3 [Pristis pectinata]